MAVYKNDTPEWLTEAIDSILNQTVKSDDIIIVQDGPISRELRTVLSAYVRGKEEISTVRVKRNQGLGNALNVGLEKAKNELVMRMDADDISMLSRIELQLAEFNNDEGLSLYGGQIAEFSGSSENITSHRMVPLCHDEIIRFSKRRNPFNHPTVMFKKRVIKALGGYNKDAIRVEDYDLWLRLLSEGYCARNSSSVLLKYRSNINAVKRRKTYVSLRSNISARIKFLKAGYISFSDLLYGVISQTLLFVLPARIASGIIERTVRK